IPKRAPPDPATLSPDFAAQIPMGSLGQFLRPDLGSFPASAGYLRSDPKRSAAYAQRLRDGLAASDLVVGISWSSKNKDLGPHKSILLKDWAPILQTPGLRFVDLQYDQHGELAVERAEVEKILGVTVEHLPDLDLFNDIDGLAGLISACDLVI